MKQPAEQPGQQPQAALKSDRRLNKSFGRRNLFHDELWSVVSGLRVVVRDAGLDGSVTPAANSRPPAPPAGGPNPLSRNASGSLTPFGSPDKLADSLATDCVEFASFLENQ